MRSRTAVAGLAALAAANVVLVPLALRMAQGDAGSDRSPGSAADLPGGVATAPAPPPWLTPSREPEPATAADGSAAAAGGSPAPAGALDTAAGLAVHASPGACGDGAGAIRTSTDGGRTWATVAVPARNVLRILIVDPNRIWLVGTDAGCRERVYHTLDRGATWRSLPSTAGTWHRAAVPGMRQIHAPQGSVAAPCTGNRLVVELVAADASTAAVRCGDGAVYHTADAARTWNGVPAIAGAVRAVAFGGPENLYAAAAGADGCAGLRVSRRPGAGTWETLGCVPDPATAAGATLSFVDPGAGMLVAGTATYATTDGGRTWERRDAPPPPAPTRSHAAKNLGLPWPLGGPRQSKIRR